MHKLNSRTLLLEGFMGFLSFSWHVAGTLLSRSINTYTGFTIVRSTGLLASEQQLRELSIDLARVNTTVPLEAFQNVFTQVAHNPVLFAYLLPRLCTGSA